jgi:hypothetical protein
LDKLKFSDDLVELGNLLNNLPAEVISDAQIHNQWFTPDFINLAARNWHKALNAADISQWIKNVPAPKVKQNVGIIMAGNIPFVGLHDLLSVLATGNKAMVKLSGTDEVLMKFVIKSLMTINSDFKDCIEITERLNGVDRVIATGSNNSSRYFEYYFKDKKTLIRKNRTSIAVLTGKESKEQLEALADDIYCFFGLGCRNVTHILMPKSIDLHTFYTALDKYMDHVHHHKFYNNYMYHKSILLMNLTKHYDNGFMIFQEKEELGAPLATLNYHYYEDEADILQFIAKNNDKLQCVVSISPSIKNAVNFGESQQPRLWDYADNVNTLDFLTH